MVRLEEPLAPGVAAKVNVCVAAGVTDVMAAIDVEPADAVVSKAVKDEALLSVPPDAVTIGLDEVLGAGERLKATLLLVVDADMGLLVMLVMLPVDVDVVERLSDAWTVEEDTPVEEDDDIGIEAVLLVDAVIVLVGAVIMLVAAVIVLVDAVIVLVEPMLIVLVDTVSMVLVVAVLIDVESESLDVVLRDNVVVRDDVLTDAELVMTVEDDDNNDDVDDVDDEVVTGILLVELVELVASVLVVEALAILLVDLVELRSMLVVELVLCICTLTLCVVLLKYASVLGVTPRTVLPQGIARPM